MFAREVTVTLKANSQAGFTQATEEKVIPILRKEAGFRDEITFVSQDGASAVGISLWDNQENAEAYSRGSYAKVLESLGTFVEGTPQVKTYQVANSTWHKIAATRPA